MNKYINEIRKTVLGHEDKLDKLKTERETLKATYESGSMAKNTYEKQAESIQSSGVVSNETNSKINETVEKYSNELETWAVLDAQDLTDDIKLFNSPIDISREDYMALEEKYKGNYSMLKALKDHARKNEVTYTSKYSINKEEKLEQLERFRLQARQIVQSMTDGNTMSYNARVWQKDETFDNLYADTSNTIKTNE